MKRDKQWPLILSALLLTALGAVMPHTVSTIQDSAVETETESRPFDPVDLKLMNGEDVRDVLRLLGGSYSDFDDLEWTGNTKLTEEEAADAAREVVKLLEEKGIAALRPENMEYGESYAQPHLIMSMDKASRSALVWICFFEWDPSNWIFIDDETGKMVRALLPHTGTGDVSIHESMSASASSIYVDKNEPAVLENLREEIVKRAELWREFLSEYYGMEMMFGNTEIYDGYNGEATLLFNHGENMGSVRLEIYESSVYFNP